MAFNPGNIGETITSFFDNPELNKTKAALEGLAKEVKENQKPEVLLKRVQDAFYADLKELKVPENLWPAYWEKVDAKIREYIEARKAEAAAASPEAQALEAFVGDMSNLAGLEPLIAEEMDKHPIRKWWNGLTKDYPDLRTWAAGWFLKSAEEDKVKNGGKDTVLGGFCRRLGNAILPEQAQAQTPTAAPAAPGAAPAAQAEAAQAAPETDYEFRYFFDKYKVDPNAAETKADVAALKRDYPQNYTAYAHDARNPDSIVGRLYQACDKRCGSSADKFNRKRLLDIRFQALRNPADIERVTQAITGTDGTSATPEKLRKFLDEIRLDQDMTAEVERLKHHLA